MSHNDYVRRDGQWGGNPVLLPRDLRRFDVAQFETLNGDDGGTWNPETPIILGGSGLSTIGAAAHQITGGVETRNGGRIELHASAWPGLTSAPRVLRVPLVSIHTDLADSYQVEASIDPVGTRIAAVLSQQLQWTVPQRYLHHGGTLTGISLTFRVGTPHLGVPGTRLPQFTLSRFHLGRGAVDAIANGTLSAPGTGTAYYANGNAQTVNGTITGNQVIDVGLYTYILQILDEFGTNSLPGNVYTSLALTYGSIADLRSE